MAQSRRWEAVASRVILVHERPYRLPQTTLRSPSTYWMHVRMSAKCRADAPPSTRVVVRGSAARMFAVQEPLEVSFQNVNGRNNAPSSASCSLNAPRYDTLATVLARPGYEGACEAHGVESGVQPEVVYRGRSYSRARHVRVNEY